MMYRGRDWPERLLAIFGALVAILGITVLFGWYRGLPQVTHFFWALTPMAPRTALSFFCLGLGLLAFARSRRTAAILVALASVIHVLTLLEYWSAVDFALDRPLHLPSHTIVSRAAPNTSACFVLLCLALVLMCLRPFRGRSALLGLSSSAAFGLAVTSLVGYASGVRTFEWGQFTPMA